MSNSTSHMKGNKIDIEVLLYLLISFVHFWTGDGTFGHGHMEFRLRNLLLVILFKFNTQ